MSAPESTAPVLRDQNVATAFAAADLLVEASTNGRISHATGPFRQRMGHSPEDLVGRHATSLVAESDRVALSMALAGIAERGRIAPMVVRLNDTARSELTLAGMMVPGRPPRLCLTLGPVTDVPLAGTTPAPDGRGFAREADAQLREAGGGQMVLIEVRNWQLLREALSGEQQQALVAEFAKAFGPPGNAVRVQEIADGRFGVLLREPAGLPGALQWLDTLLRATPGGRQARADGIAIALDAGALPASQAARVLRYTLSQFRAGGVEAARVAAGRAGHLQDAATLVEQRAQGLRARLADRRFQVKYQPVVSLVNRSVQHFECLLRPFTPAGSQPLGAGDFVLYVEAADLTEDLDCAVTETALGTLRATPSVSISVNVSGLSLQSDAFCRRMLAMLSSAELAGPRVRERLLIELTDTAEIDDMAVTATTIAAIRNCGVRVCLDDFGGAAAAFRYLREFEFDFVKLDGSYVQNAPLGSRERSFVASMVGLAANVGARVIAEMVETPEQAQLMRMLGVEFGQGYLFGRPGMLSGSDR